MGEQRFKVGDRVTNNHTTFVDVEKHWNENFRRSNGDIVDGALVVASVSERRTGSNIGLSNKVGRAFFYMPESTLKFAEPATLKIEAGKFYKTRDGRKVLVESNGDGAYPWFHDMGKGSFHALDVAGKSCINCDEDDIIAEWIDEPVAKASNDNTTPKFKVGERVRGVINPIEYEVLKVHANGSLDVRACGSWCQYTNQRAMDFVNITRSTTIVALIENGKPKPSSTPHVHASTVAAEKEAKRLAAKYKGKQFGVFTLTTTHEEAAPVYDHKWQNMAALGLKSDAIASLKAQAGITTDQARRIVYAFAA